MSVRVRVLITLGRSLFQTRIDPTEVFRTNMVVGPTEADVRFVSNAR